MAEVLDKIWVYKLETEFKHESMKWHKKNIQPQKSLRCCSRLEDHGICFLECRGYSIDC